MSQKLINHYFIPSCPVYYKSFLPGWIRKSSTVFRLFRPMMQDFQLAQVHTSHLFCFFFVFFSISFLLSGVFQDHFFKTVALAFRAQNPSYVPDLLQPHIPTRSLCSSGQRELAVPCGRFKNPRDKSRQRHPSFGIHCQISLRSLDSIHFSKKHLWFFLNNCLKSFSEWGFLCPSEFMFLCIPVFAFIFICVLKSLYCLFYNLL